VVRNSSIRVLLALAAELDLDVTTDFLNGDLQEEVYMCQPEGFIKKGEEQKVCLLKKALYGLKQSSRAWNKKIHSPLLELGLKRSEYEPCIYYSMDEQSTMIVALYVDDLLLFSDNESKKEKLKGSLMKKFKMKDMVEASQYLGMTISHDRKEKTVQIDQGHYIKQILKKSGMEESKPVVTPMEVNQKLPTAAEEEKEKFSLTIPMFNRVLDVFSCLY
jgi:hypothetical protein